MSRDVWLAEQGARGLCVLSFCSTRDSNEMQNLACDLSCLSYNYVPFGVTYEKIGTIQRRFLL